MLCPTRHRPIAFLLTAALFLTAAAGYCRYTHTKPVSSAITMAEPPRTVSDTPIQADYRPVVPQTPEMRIVQAAETIIEETPIIEAEPAQEDSTPAAPASMANCLLIGDSRTVGLQMFGELKESDFFASTGLGPQKIGSTRIEMDGLGKLTLSELLACRSYERIYLMMGINDVGYPAGSTMKKYAALVEQICTAQPDALLILMGNLHVTKAWSDHDTVINNPVLDAFNAETAALADGQTIFYLDPNPLFDDADGALSIEKCSDGAHIRPRYYIEWSQWLAAKSGEILASLQGADTE